MAIHTTSKPLTTDTIMGFSPDDECLLCYLNNGGNNLLHRECRDYCDSPCGSTGESSTVCETCLGNLDGFERISSRFHKDKYKDSCRVCDVSQKCYTVISCDDHHRDLLDYFGTNDESSDGESDDDSDDNDSNAGSSSYDTDDLNSIPGLAERITGRVQ